MYPPNKNNQELEALAAQKEKEIAEIFQDISRKLVDVTIDDEIIGEPEWDKIDPDSRPLTRNWLNLPESDSALKRLNARLEGSYSTEHDRSQRYVRLARAQNQPEIAGILNIYADEALAQNADGQIFNFYCSDKEVVDIAKDLIARVGLEDGTRAWTQLRNMCGFGDEYGEVIIAKNKREIHSVRHVPKELLVRVEKNNILQHFLVNKHYAANNPQGQAFDLVNQKITTSNEDQKIEPFRILHWRIESPKYYPYGESVIDSVLAVTEELQLMEKALIISRIVRAPERRVYNVNVGQAQGKTAIAAAHEIVKGLKRKKVLDAFQGNKLDEQNDFFSEVEDMVIPRRSGEEPNTVDTLPQLNLQEPADLEFVRDRIFPGTGVVRQYLFDDTFQNANVNLSNKSMQFAKRMRRIQKFYLSPIYKMCLIEFRLRGINKSRYEDFVITMNNPSNLDELQKLELETQRWTLATTIKSLNTDPTKPFVSDYDIFKNIFNKNEAEILEIMRNAKVQGKAFNPFQFIDEDLRPEGYQILDQIDAMQPAGAPAAPPEGGGPVAPPPGDQIPPEAAAELGTPPTPETPPSETNPPPETAPEATPAAAGQEAPATAELAGLEREIAAGDEVFTEDRAAQLKKKAIERKQKYLLKKKNPGITPVTEEDLKVKMMSETRPPNRISYFERMGEINGIREIFQDVPKQKKLDKKKTKKL